MFSRDFLLFFFLQNFCALLIGNFYINIIYSCPCNYLILFSAIEEPPKVQKLKIKLPKRPEDQFNDNSAKIVEPVLKSPPLKLKISLPKKPSTPSTSNSENSPSKSTETTSENKRPKFPILPPRKEETKNVPKISFLPLKEPDEKVTNDDQNPIVPPLQIHIPKGRGRGRGRGRGTAIRTGPKISILPIKEPSNHQQEPKVPVLNIKPPMPPPQQASLNKPMLGKLVTRTEPIVDKPNEPKVSVLNIKKSSSTSPTTDKPVLGKFVTRAESIDKPKEPKIPILNIKKSSMTPPASPPVLGKFVTRIEKSEEENLIIENHGFTENQIPLDPIPIRVRGRGRGRGRGRAKLSNGISRQPKIPILPPKDHNQPMLGEFVTRSEKAEKSSKEPKVPILHIKTPLNQEQSMLGKFASRPEIMEKPTTKEPKVPVLNIKKPLMPPPPPPDLGKRSTSVENNDTTKRVNKVPVLHIKTPKSEQNSRSVLGKLVSKKVPETNNETVQEEKSVPKINIPIPKLKIKKNSLKVDQPNVIVQDEPVTEKHKILPCRVNLKNLDIKTSPVKITDEDLIEKRPAIKLSMKTLKSKAEGIKPLPSLKIKLPTRPKRSLLNVLTGLTKSLPKPKEPSTPLPKEEIIENNNEKELEEEALKEHVAKNVDLNEAMDIVESELVASVILKDLVKKAVKKPKLKKVTFKLNDVIKKPNFKVIRVAPSLNKKVKRPGSGLTLNDYKGKKRKRPKKLDKLIIRNIASLAKEPNSEEICSSILNKTVDNLPCFKLKNTPVMIKIRKDPSIPSLKMKTLFKNSNKKRKTGLERQLEIDMVGGEQLKIPDSFYRRANLDAKKALVVPMKRKVMKINKTGEGKPIKAEKQIENVNKSPKAEKQIENVKKPAKVEKQIENMKKPAKVEKQVEKVNGSKLKSEKRNIKLEARKKALVVPSKRKNKTNKTEERSPKKLKTNKTNEKPVKNPTRQSPKTIENIFDQIMGDEENSTSSEEGVKSIETPIAQKISQMVKEEVAKEFELSNR